MSAAVDVDARCWYHRFALDTSTWCEAPGDYGWSAPPPGAGQLFNTTVRWCAAHKFASDVRLNRAVTGVAS